MLSLKSILNPVYNNNKNDLRFGVEKSISKVRRLSYMLALLNIWNFRNFAKKLPAIVSYIKLW